MPLHHTSKLRCCREGSPWDTRVAHWSAASSSASYAEVGAFSGRFDAEGKTLASELCMTGMEEHEPYSCDAVSLDPDAASFDVDAAASEAVHAVGAADKAGLDFCLMSLNTNDVSWRHAVNVVTDAAAPEYRSVSTRCSSCKEGRSPRLSSIDEPLMLQPSSCTTLKLDCPQAGRVLPISGGSKNDCIVDNSGIKVG